MPTLYRPDRRPSAGSWLSKGGSDETSCVRGGLSGKRPCSPKEIRYGAFRRCSPAHGSVKAKRMIWQSMLASNRLRSLHGIERTSFPPCLPLKNSAMRSKSLARKFSPLWSLGSVNPLCLHRHRQKCLKNGRNCGQTSKKLLCTF